MKRTDGRSSSERTNWSHGELEMRNGLFLQSRARDCQEIKELRRFCYEEANKTIQSRIEEMCMNQEGPSVVIQDMSEIQELQNKVNSSTDARDFHDPERFSSSGSSHVPTRSLTIPSRSEKPSREPATPNGTRSAYGYFGQRLLKANLLENDNPYTASRILGIWQCFFAKGNKTGE